MAAFDLLYAVDLLKRAEEWDVKISFEREELAVRVNRDRRPDAAFLEELKANKGLLVDYFRNRAGRRSGRSVAEVAAAREAGVLAPLSFAQERLWFVDRLEGSVQHHLPWVFRLNGVLEADALEAAFRDLVQRHESLRTVIVEEGGQGFQQVQDAGQWQLRTITLSDVLNKASSLEAFVQQTIETPFDLRYDWPLRVTLVSLSAEEHLLIGVVHHIAFDGWSIGILVNELAELYISRTEGRRPDLMPLPVQYGDYALWQRDHLQGERLEEQRHYWQAQLQDVSALDLPMDHPRPARQDFTGGLVQASVGADLLADLKRLSKQKGATLFMTLLAAFKVLLYKYGNQKDICVGTPVAGRGQQELEGLIGFFINTLPLRSQIDPYASFEALLQQVKATTLGAYEHGELPFEKIVEAAEVDRDLSRSTLFQAVFALHNTPQSAGFALGDVSVTAERPAAVRCLYDIDLDAIEEGGVLYLSLTYATSILEATTAQNLLKHYLSLLKAVVKDSASSVLALNLLDADEKEKLLAFGGTASPYPSDATVISLFAEQVAARPLAPALTFEGHTLSYQELDARTNQLAHYLLERGVVAEQLIPICLERSADLIIAILAVLKAGAAYVPIDPSYPAARIQYLMDDCDAHFVLTNSSTSFESEIDRIELDELELSSYSTARVSITVTSSSLAYLLYTSGSTGQPKGVLVEHGNIVSLVKNAGFIELSEKDVLLSTGSPSFDATTIEYWGMLLNGGHLMMCNQDDLLDSTRLKQTISEEGVTAMWFTAGWFNQLVETDSNIFASLKTVMVGGDRLSPRHVQKLKEEFPKLVLINGYGPTENTTFALTHLIEGSDGVKDIPIGKPLTNRTAYILDEARNLCPIGVLGELYVGGAGLSRGYWKQPALTQEKFIEIEGLGRLYNTGDLARWTAKGIVEFFGRRDGQIKIRGYRIEIGEIETALQTVSSIKEAVILVHEEEGGKRLIGYVVTDENYDQVSTIDALHRTLPDYMVPTALIQIDAIPLTGNGKIDRKTLLENFVLPALNKIYTAPRNEIEQALAGIWQELLELDRVSIYDDFFELGGHSLLAIRLLSAIRSTLGKEVAIRDVFEQPTIASLALQLAGDTAATELVPTIQRHTGAGPVPLSYGQERLWFIDRLQGSLHYHMPWVFRLEGPLDVPALESSFRAIMERHEVLRTVIREQKGVGYQVVADAANWHIGQVRAEEIAATGEELGHYLERWMGQPYDLSASPMLRVLVVELGEEEYLLATVIHHIAFDGWSIGIMVRELSALYRSYTGGASAQLPALPIQYADYAAWQHEHLSGDRLEQKLAYWKQQLKDTSVLDLPADHPRSALTSVRGQVASHWISKDVHERLSAYAQENGATLFMVLLAAFKVLLYKYSGQSDICVGTPIAGRQHREVEGLIGFFINTLALRTEVNGGQTFDELLADVRQTTLDAYEHQDVPFEKIVEALGITRDLQRNPIFQVLFALQNAPDTGGLDLDGISIRRENYGLPAAQFDLNLNINEDPDGLLLNLTYSSDLYEEATVTRMLAHYELVLRSIIAQKRTPLQNIMLLTDEESSELRRFGRGEEVEPSEETVVSLFLTQAQHTPSHPALISGTSSLTYQQLDEQTNRLARHLLSLGITAGQTVALCLPSSMYLPQALLAVLKTGAAYLPLDPSAPPARLAHLLEDSAASLIITTSAQAHLLPANMPYILIDEAEQLLSAYEPTQPEITITPSSLAYVLYTSGSTGKPKGVLVAHRSLTRYLLTARDLYIDRKTSNTSGAYAHLVPTFDAALTALLTPLISGKAVVISSSTGAAAFEDPALQANAPYDFIKITPAHLPLLETLAGAGGVAKLTRRLVIGGEALKESQLVFLKGEHVEIINEYGPTEATVGCSVYQAYTDEEMICYTGGLSIGKPMPGVQLLVLDEAKGLCPIGVAGELYIGGTQVARGYLNLPELTEARFIQNPHGEDRLYRTGDRARWHADGQLEFLGRSDEQVKIRGYRIELGEIETALQQIDTIKEAVVLVHEETGEKRLVAYVVTDEEYDQELTRQELQKLLPDYMIPTVFIQIDSIPLTTNGKVDRKQLLDAFALPASTKAYTAPRNELEQTLAGIWQELLEVERISIYDDFFQLGGHSLLAIRLIAAIRSQLQRELTIRDVFDHPTLERQAALVAAIAKEVQSIIQPVDRTGRLPLSFAQERLWFIDRLQGSLAYHMPWVFRLKGALDIDVLEASFRTIIQRHEVLRTVIGEEEGVGYQQVTDNYNDWHLHIIHQNEWQSQTTIQKLISRTVSEPYQLNSSPMLRVQLIEVGDEEHILVAVVHHIAFDGWSIGVIVKELTALYQSGIEGKKANLKPLPVQYGDYAVWQREQLSGENLERSLSYWRRQLEHTEPLQLLTDHSRPATPTSNGDTVQLLLSADLQAQAQTFARQEGVTPYMLLLAVFKTLLHRHTGQSDICIGTPVAGRQHKELEQMAGFFINTLPLRSRVDGSHSFKTFLQELRQTTLDAYAHQELPFEKLVDHLDLPRDMGRNPLFQVMFVLQNMPGSEPLSLGPVQLEETSLPHTTSLFDLTLVIQTSDDGLQLSLTYSTDLFRNDTANRLLDQYSRLLQAAINTPEQKLSLLPLMDAEERDRLLHGFNNTAQIFPSHQTLIDLFDQQITQRATSEALVFEDQHWTYQQLEGSANRLAHHLRAKGLQTEDIVGICLDRSPEMIVAIFAVLKAGGAYLPIDPQYPQERIAYMIADSGCKQLITTSEHRPSLNANNTSLTCLDEDAETLAQHSADPLPSSPQPHHLAYVIYTSGSTGQPKGVMIEHRQAVNLVHNQVVPLNLHAGMSVFQFASFSFDACCHEVFCTLLTGGCLILAPRQILTDPVLLAQLVAQHGVELITLPPSYQPEFAAQHTGLRTIISAGEKMNIHAAKALQAQGITVINAYGPTENTVSSILTPEPIQPDGRVIIGRPLANVRAYVLDGERQPVPIGVPGELFLGGAQVARGYLGRPELTAERFLPDPFSNEPGARLYRTGDWVRWLPTGDMEYLDRFDEQVKIRGYRIELGEIEAALLGITGIRQAAVAVRTDAQDHKRLVAYVVAGQWEGRDALLAHLHSRLPDHMVPGTVIELQQLPLLPNGKVNRKALPDPTDAPLSSAYTAPRNGTEQALADIWQELLGISRVGIHDNFFELGGDSIITIQVVSRAKRKGYQFTPRDLFLHQTINGLATIVQQGDKATLAEQGKLEGESGLLPIQHWYFNQSPAQVSHFNQSVLLAIDKSINAVMLQAAIDTLAEHHDALRFAYKHIGSDWQQQYSDARIPLEVSDLRVATLQALPGLIEQVANRCQRSLAIEQGKVVKFLWIKTPRQDGNNRLLLVIHHLVVDGVSWRILLEDLGLLLTALQKVEAISLGAKTSSYRQWYEALDRYSQSPDLAAQLPYWQQAQEAYAPLPRDNRISTGVTGVRHHSLGLEAGLTQSLLRTTSVYHTEINDLLLAALAQTLCLYAGRNQVVIGMEGHGREDIDAGIDTSRTVGWFTSLYPVLLRMETGNDEASLIKSTKEQLRRLPGKGLGYGVLKYLNGEDSLQGAQPWDVVFNYLGQLDQIVSGENSLLLPAGESTGQSADPAMQTDPPLSINTSIQGGQLIITWSFDEQYYEPATIENLADNYLQLLAKLVQHVAAQTASFVTPSDYGLEQYIDHRSLDAFLDEEMKGQPRRVLVESMYPLSGLQQGLLFHSLYEGNAGAYLEQFACTLTDVDLAAFRQSWNRLLARHSILRTAFYGDRFDVPVQCVYRDVQLPETLKDLRALDAEAQQAAIREFEDQDRLKPFDLSQAPLMRVSLLRLDEKAYRMLWTHHHLIGDGWSLQVLMEEFLTTYEALAAGQSLPAVEPDRYEEFIRHALRQSGAHEQAYWKGYMKGLEEGSLLPFIDSKERNMGVEEYNALEWRLDPSRTRQLQSFAQRERVTVNTVVQGVWSYLLHRYTGRKGVVFGMTVSGRPEDLSGVEQRVGMYINTLPVHTQVEEGAAVGDWLRGLQEDQQRSREYQFSSVTDIQRWAGIPGDLFDTLLTFQNYPVSEVVTARQWRLGVEEPRLHEQTSNYPLTIRMRLGSDTLVQFMYKRQVLGAREVEMMRRHFEHVLIQLIEGAARVERLQLLDAGEMEELLSLAGVKQSYPSEETVVGLFAAQAKATPSAPALTFEGITLNYKELDERTNQLAHWLLQRGVAAEELVPICLERSADLLIAILGVMKAGAAYVPIDPSYPAARIHYLMNDCDARFVLTNSNTSFDSDIDRIELDVLEQQLATYLATLPETKLTPSSLAYLIYTSGSTGQPKGVLVEHKNIVSLVKGAGFMDLTGADVLISTGSPAFDATTFEYWGALLNGGRLVMCRQDDLLDAGRLKQIIRKEGVTMMWITAGWFNQLIETDPTVFASVQKIITGGDRISPRHIHQLQTRYPQLVLINGYGPTENTTFSLTHRIGETDGIKDIPIGKALNNRTAYILDEAQRLCPVGVIGELYVGGDGLGRGYWKQPVLTQEKFVVMEGLGRLYRTGDMARWNTDGQVEFFGRRDAQVKIRGYRIELGEIETVLHGITGIREAVVLAQEDEGGKRLVGYVVTDEHYDQDHTAQELHKALPDYMVPAVFIQVNEIPLNTNGKVDRKRLLEAFVLPASTQAYAAPRNELEQALAGIWQELLDVERVGIHDNFFELGGDSIITIQVVSRARRLGYDLQVAEMFAHQTIAELSALTRLSNDQSAGPAEILQGESGLLPIQHWYFASGQKNVSHFNQSVLLAIDRSVSEDTIQLALNTLVQHHDALRFSYTRIGNSWQQQYGSIQPIMEIADLRKAAPSAISSLIEEEGDRCQRSLDIEEGKVVKVLFIQTPEGEERNRLLLVLHHLVVDGVSWRILLEDLELLLTAAQQDQTISLGKKTSSYRQWHETLVQYGQSPRAQRQLPYWTGISAQAAPLPTPKTYGGSLRLRQMHQHVTQLEAAGTRRLLQELPRVYRTEINDILLAALAQTLCQYAGRSQVVIGLEGHGREDIDRSIDTSRTVGWFTSLYPVLLRMDENGNEASLIKSTKEQLRLVPDKGLGYGVLKYLNREAALQGEQPWNVVFNYLGQLDKIVGSKSGLLATASEPTGDGTDLDSPPGYLLGINALVHEGRLMVSWTWSSEHFEAGDIETLSANYLQQLEALIRHGQEQKDSYSTPSDYGLEHEVDYRTLDAFLDEEMDGQPRRALIENIARLAPLQEGLLFHSLYEAQGHSYVEQLSCDLENLDEDVFRQSWNRLLERHTMLRTGFFHDAFSIPMQCIYRKVEMPLAIHDLRQYTGDALQEAVARYEQADRCQPFDFERAPVMRVTLLRLGDDRYRMLWTVHHIVFDGWSKPIIMEEFLRTYELLASGKELPAMSADRYEDYIHYIEQRSDGREEAYWRNYLSGLDEGSLLPFTDSKERNKGVEDHAAQELLLPVAQSEALQAFAQRERVTVNTVVQGVWSYLLHRYTGNRDVVFGVTVSGRPEDLPGVEQRVGMYINTLPMYARVGADEEVGGWLRELQQDQQRSREYQYSSVNDIQRWTGIPGDLFDTMITFQNYPVSAVIDAEPWQLKATFVALKEYTPNYPLSLRVMQGASTLVQFIYKRSLLSEEVVKMICGHFERVLQSIVEGTVMIRDLELMADDEAAQLLSFGGTTASYPAEATVVSLFAEQVTTRPSAPALTFEGRTLRYRELDERTNQLAHYLLERGVMAEQLIPICLERSADLIIAILAVLKAGAAYVPIDPSYPAARIQYLMEDCDAHFVLTNSSTSFDSDVERIDLDEIDLASHPNTQPDIHLTSSSLAYLLYTSGSTGQPKGVLVEHGNIVSLVKNAGFIELSEEDVLLSTGSPSFDATTIEYWGMLLNGGRLVMCSQDDLLDSNRLKQTIAEEGVNTMWFTAGWFNQLVETDSSIFSSLKTVMVGGDRLSPKYVQKLKEEHPQLVLINGYGPTENTTFSLTHLIEGSDGVKDIPIGKPLNNRTAYILDEAQSLCPIGVRGELYVGGAGLSRGYWKQPALTQEKFIEVEGLGRLYNTGDLAQWTNKGVVEFFGRRDGQIKIRGYRIEIGEIESALLNVSGIKEAVVLVTEEEEGKRLIGYVVAHESYDQEQTLITLRNLLPDYMVPTVLIRVDAIPLTTNGKVDRKKLLDSFVLPASNKAYTAPRNEIEQALLAIWQDLLELDRISIYDDFFELGGHSLLAIRLLSAIRSNLGKEVAIRDVFEQPTIAALAQQLSGDTAPAELLPAIHRHTGDGPIPLSYGQERLWFIDRLQGSVAYHLPWVFRLKGRLDSDALEQCFRTIIHRHEVLRTVIHEEEGLGRQVIIDASGWQLHRVHQTPDPARFIESFVQQPYNLSKDHMLKAALVHLSDEEHLLAVVVHHIAFDGWSISIIVRELTELYRSHREQRPPQLAELPIQYSDYAFWQRQYLTEDLLGQKLAYWTRQLEDTPPLELPTETMRPASPSAQGAATGLIIGKDLHDRLQQCAQQEGATLFMTLLAAFNVLLHRYTGQTDICVGAPIAGRQQQETEGLIGFFVNILAYRSQVEGNATFRELLRQVKQTTLMAYKHQDVPFEKIVEALGIARDLSRNPVFQVVFVMENTPPSGDLDLGGISLSGDSSGEVITKFDLTLHAAPAGDGLQLQIIYRRELFNESAMRRLLAHFRNLLELLSANPDARIGTCNFLEAAEIEQLESFGRQSVPYPDTTVVALFEQQAAAHPGQPAVVFDSQSLTYKELDESANQLAHFLRSRGVRAGQLVPMCMERSADMIVGLLAIMKAGGAYVPIDPEYPDDRIRYMLEDIAPTVILAGAGKGRRVDGIAADSNQLGDAVVVSLEDDELFIQSAPRTKVDAGTTAADPAYMIYTSGSTGRAKGVIISHCSLVDYFFGLDHQLPIRDCALFALVSTLSADLGNTVIYGALLSGGTLHVCSHATINDAVLMLEYCRRHRIDCLKIVPSHWKALCLDGDLLLPARLLIFGGELLQGAVIRQIRAVGAACQVVNHYGPTETTIGKLLHKVDLSAPYGHGVPIGRPFSNTRVLVLNRQLALCPPGAAGEICIAGDGLARGYLNQPQLTEEKFVSDPISGERMYRTGDIGRWLPDGNIEYLGRADDQVKIRGFRIELGEIERALLDAPNVQQAVVLARAEDNGDKRLAAYVVARAGWTKEETITYLRTRLPDYMVPAQLMQLEEIPLTSNGKIDRKRLPEKAAAPVTALAPAAPRNPLEETLVEIWQELLGLERVGIHDNFFELGGDSIITIQIVSRARRLGYELQVGDLFEHQTIATLARGYADREQGVESTAEQGLLTGPSGLLPIQRWFFDSEPVLVSHYNQSVLLGIDKSVTDAQLQQALEQLMRHHDALRFVYTQHIHGWEQHYGTGLAPVETLDLGDVPDEDLPAVMETHNDQYQRSLHIERGELVRLVLIRTALTQTHNRILFIIHHLAVDGVSWRILLEDFEVLLKGIKFNAPISLGSKTHSYREWQQALVQYAQSPAVQAQKPYWAQIADSYTPLPADRPHHGPVSFGDIGNHTVTLDATRTRALLQEVPKKYHTEINDLLLGALSRTLCRFAATPQVVIGLEGHGREQLEGMDTSRTAGWFTIKYPVLLECTPGMNNGDLLKSIKERLRRIPAKGMGYPVLRYLDETEGLKRHCWDIVFNYLGQFDNVGTDSKLLTGAAESTGSTIAADNPCSFQLGINSLVQGGQLAVSWSYSRRHFEAATIAGLAEQYLTDLAALITHCQEQDAPVFTPSDYGLSSDISYTELDEFLRSKGGDEEADDIMVF